jgi:hypothetical protein
LSYGAESEYFIEDNQLIVMCAKPYNKTGSLRKFDANYNYTDLTTDFEYLDGNETKSYCEIIFVNKNLWFSGRGTDNSFFTKTLCRYINGSVESKNLSSLLPDNIDHHFQDYNTGKHIVMLRNRDIYTLNAQLTEAEYKMTCSNGDNVQLLSYKGKWLVSVNGDGVYAWGV